jgi:hypothetical protein
MVMPRGGGGDTGKGGKMRGDFDEDEDPDFEPEYGCNTCMGSGFIVVCINDMCRGAGECLHGDGEIVCPECNGENA